MARPGGFSASMAHRLTPAEDATDFFPTPPWGGRVGGELIRRIDPCARSVLDPACGAQHLAHGLRGVLPDVRISDLHQYGSNPVADFVHGVDSEGFQAVDWIATNPPFAPAAAFVERALKLATRGVAMLTRAQFDESETRHALMHGPEGPHLRAVFSERIAMTKGRWEPGASTAQAYCWWLWVKPCVRSPLAVAGRDARRRFGAALSISIPPGTKARLTHASDAAFAMVEG